MSNIDHAAEARAEAEKRWPMDLDELHGPRKERESLRRGYELGYLAASRREPSESTAPGASDGTSKSNANDLDREPSANVSNHPETDISSGEMSVSVPSDTDERWEYGYYDSDDANDPARVFHQYVQGWSFPTAEAAKHTGDKNVFGKAIIVRRHPASDWEVCDEH